MKKLTICIFVLAALLWGCAKESILQPTDTTNVTMTVSDVTPIGVTVAIQDSNPEPFVYGTWYRIEQEKGGIWYEVKTKITNYGFDEIGWLTDDQGMLTMTVDWEWLYGKLAAGHYRILKEAGGGIISAEFDVE